jgi:V/A-type H+-transporting ATPase subunit B
MPTGLIDLLHHTHVTAIVGDLLKIRANDVGLGDMAVVEMPDGAQSLAQAIQLDGDEVSLQVFGGGKGLSTQATVAQCNSRILRRKAYLAPTQAQC